MNKRQYELIKLIENGCQSPIKINDNEILAWLYFDQIENFVKIIGYDFLCEGFDVNLGGESICINLKEVIDYMGIDEDIFDIDIN